MGLDSKLWGPSLWMIFHSIALQYPQAPTPAQKKQYSQFFLQWEQLIPCEHCRQHYWEIVTQTLPLREEHELASAKQLFEWTVDLHNEVNKSLRKPTWDYKKAYTFYKTLYSSSSPLTKSIYYTNYFKFSSIFYLIFVVIVSLILAVLFYVIYFLRHN